MKRQPSQLKTELRVNGAGERGLYKEECLFANSFLCSKRSQDLWQKEFLSTGLPIELLVICSNYLSPGSLFLQPIQGVAAEIWGVGFALLIPMFNTVKVLTTAELKETSLLFVY